MRWMVVNCIRYPDMKADGILCMPAAWTEKSDMCSYGSGCPGPRHSLRICYRIKEMEHEYDGL